MKYINQMEFKCSSITRQEYIFIVALVKINNFYKILEIGPGISSFSFSENNCDLYSFEHHPIWYKKILEKVSDLPNIKIYLYKNKINLNFKEIKGQFFDLGFIDSPPGGANPGRKEMCDYVSNKTNVIILHDTNREYEKNIVNYFVKDKEWKNKYIKTQRGINILYKKNILIPDINRL